MHALAARLMITLADALTCNRSVSSTLGIIAGKYPIHCHNVFDLYPLAIFHFKKCPVIVIKNGFDFSIGTGDSMIVVE